MAEEAWGVGLLVVAMFAKSFLEEFVGKDTGLGKAIHAFADFNVDVVLVNLLLQLIMVNDVWWEQGDRHVHVFVAVEWSLQKHVLYVGASKACTRCADGAVPEEF